MYNILIGGAAGQGIDTTASILEKVLKRRGYNIFSTRDYMSRIRGGHNFIQIRFGKRIITSHSEKLDGIIALNNETVEIHSQRLNENGFILCDSDLVEKDKRAVRIGMDEIAKTLGNPKVSGSVGVGAVLKLLGENLEKVREAFEEFIKPEYLEVNLKAVSSGYDKVDNKFPSKKVVSAEKLLINGNQAIALGAITAGLRFYSAYPMTPSTSIMNYLASKMAEAGIVVEQAEDEIAAVNMAIGASFAGARAMTGTSGGGFCLMVEALGLSGMAEIPLVVADIQRPGPVTGFPTRTEQSDLKFVISASHGEFPRMVIALRNPSDAFYQTIRAFNIAEKYQIPVIIMGDQYLADTNVTVEPFDLTKISIENPVYNCQNYTDSDYLRYKLTADGISPRLIPGKCETYLVSSDSDEHDENGRITESAEMRIKMMDKRLGKIKLLEKELIEPDFTGDKNCDVLLLGWGSTQGAITEAVALLNNIQDKKYGALVFGDIYPLPVKLLKEKAAYVKQIINIEQNATGQLASLVMEHTGIKCTSSVLKYDGRQLSGEEIVQKITKGVR